MLILLKSVKMANKDTGELYEFVTHFDTSTDKLNYSVITPDGNNKLVSKEEGNKIFQKWAKNKSAQVVSKEQKKPKLSYTWYGGHYTVTIDSKTYCSCDTVQECLEEIECLKARLCL